MTADDLCSASCKATERLHPEDITEARMRRRFEADLAEVQSLLALIDARRRDD